MIIRDYITKEVLRTFGGVFIVLFLIILSTQLIKSLAAVASGKISIDFLFVLLGFRNLESMMMIIPLTLFLAILLALSRLYKDSEMVALAACGVGPSTLLKSVLIVLVSFVFIEASLALVIGPWANSKMQYMEEEFKLQADIELVVPGQFTLSNDGRRVIYAEEITDRTHLKNVFLHVDNTDNSSVLAADEANLESDPQQGARYIVFQNGHRYDGVPGSRDYRSIKFKDYGVLLTGKAGAVVKLDRNALPTRDLWDSTDLYYIGELQWRISQVIMMIVLALLAVTLSKSSPRQGRYGKMALAILIYVVYSNLLLVAFNWLRKGQVEPYIGMWWVHLLFFTLFLFMFARQMGWLSSLKRKTHNVLYCPDEFDELVED